MIFNKLTIKQQSFVAAYVSNGFNGTKAAYVCSDVNNDNSAAVTAHRMLSNINVREAVQELCGQVVEASKVDAQYLLDDLSEINEIDTSLIYDDDSNILPMKQWPLVLRKNVKEVEHDERIEMVNQVQENPETGESEMVVVPQTIRFIKKVKFHDTLKVKEMIGKHVQVAAFKENLSVQGSVGSYDVPKDQVKDLVKKMLDADDC